jgi:GTPase
VHVVDASHPDPAGQLETVRTVIGDLEARSIPEIVAFNKADLVTEDERLVLRGLEPTAVFTSAHTGEGVDELLERIAQLLPKPSIRLELLVPYDHGEVISALHEHGRILDTSYVEGGTLITALVTEQHVAPLQDYVVRGSRRS